MCGNPEKNVNAGAVAPSFNTVQEKNARIGQKKVKTCAVTSSSHVVQEKTAHSGLKKYQRMNTLSFHMVKASTKLI